MKRKLSDIDWQEFFQGKDVYLSWETFFKLLNDIILKYSPRFIFNNKCKNSIWMNSQAFSKVQIFTSNTEIWQKEHVVKLCPIMNILYLNRLKAT